MSETSRPGGEYRLAGHPVARIGFGAMSLDRFASDRAAGERLLHRAVELGIDHIDTADFYGDSLSNELIARAIGPDDGVVVVTKVGALSTPDGPASLRPAQRPAELRQAVEDNLRSLRRDRLDVVNLRRMDVGPGITVEGDQVVALDDQLAELVALRDAGVIGAIGLSAVDADSLRRALPAGIVCVQNAYGVVARRFEPMLELCAAADIAWVPFFPLGSGFPGIPKANDQPEVIAAADRLGATPAQIGLAWLLSHAPNTLLIAGTSSAEHLAENVAVGDLALDRATINELDGIWGRRFAEGADPSPR